MTSGINPAPFLMINFGNLYSEQRSPSLGILWFCHLGWHSSAAVTIKVDVVQLFTRNSGMVSRWVIDYEPPDYTEYGIKTTADIKQTGPSAIKILPLTKIASKTQDKYISNLQIRTETQSPLGYFVNSVATRRCSFPSQIQSISFRAECHFYSLVLCTGDVRLSTIISSKFEFMAYLTTHV